MGLRINTNIASITALRNLANADSAQNKSLERLSTGLRINRASDDPSGLVISEQLRAQIASLHQAMDNSTNASNLIGTSEAALSQVNDLLVQIRQSAVFALNTGGNDAEQINAEQDSIDNAIGSIDRIAQTTKFASRKLLDGSSGIRVTSQASGISGINLQNVTFDGQGSRQFTINITQIASQANVLASTSAYGGSSASGATLRITGGAGTQDIVVASSFSTAAFDDAVNALTGDTGVFASNGSLFSVDYGSNQTISVQVVSGTFNTAGGSLTNSDGLQTDSGQDVGGSINGISFDAQGNKLRVVSDVLTGDITLTQGVAAGSQTFTASDSGLVFQLNDSAATSDREQVGIRSVHSSVLGERSRNVNGIGGNTLTIGGYLSSLVSGGANDLNSNPKNALRIIDSAISQVSDLRAYLGAFQSQTVDSNTASLSVALQNLTASESSIRDLNFAQETANYTKDQILFRSGISVLAQANVSSQSVLRLLQ